MDYVVRQGVVFPMHYGNMCFLLSAKTLELSADKYLQSAGGYDG